MKSMSKARKWLFAAMGWDVVAIAIDLVRNNYAGALAVGVILGLVIYVAIATSRKSCDLLRQVNDRT